MQNNEHGPQPMIYYWQPLPERWRHRRLFCGLLQLYWQIVYHYPIDMKKGLKLHIFVQLMTNSSSMLKLSGADPLGVKY